MYLYKWAFVNSLKWYSHQPLPFCKRHLHSDKNGFWHEIPQYLFFTFQDLVFLFNLLLVNKSWPSYLHKMHTNSQSVTLLFTTSFSFFIWLKKNELNTLFSANKYKPQLFQAGNAFPETGKRLHQWISSPLLVWTLAKPLVFNTLSSQIAMEKWHASKEKPFNMHFQNKERLVYEHVLLHRYLCKHHKKTTSLRNNTATFHWGHAE